MINFTYKSKLSRITEIYGNSVLYNIPELETDVLIRTYLLQNPDQINDINLAKNSTSLLFPTVTIDLHPTENDLFRQFHRNTKKNIKRVKWEPITYKEISNPTNDEIDSFCRLFASKKSDTEMVDRLEAIRDKNALIFSYMIDETDEILCAYAYLYGEKQAFGLYATNKSNNVYTNDSLVTRVQQTLHWENMRNCKLRGCKQYNFGDTMKDLDDKERKKIQFAYAAFPFYNLRTYSSDKIKGKITISSLTRKDPHIIDSKEIGQKI